MRTTRSLWNGLVALAFALAYCAPAFALTVTVVITDHEGAPIPDCGFQAQFESLDGRYGPTATGATGADGIGVVELPAPTSDIRIEVLVVPKSCGENMWDEQRAATQRYYDLAEEHRWPRIVRIPVVTDQEAVEVTVPCARAISADVRLLRQDGNPVAAGIVVLSHGPMILGLGVNDEGRNRVRGILFGEPFAFFISGNDDNATHYFEFPASVNSTDLGDVTLPELTKNATVHLTLVDENWDYRSSERYTFPGITLIRSDGSYFLAFLANAQGQIVTNFQGTDTDLPVPAGTYYLLPGGFLHRPIDLRAFDLVRSGQTHLVPDWPTITVAPGGTATATVHAAALDAAIRATMPPE